MSNRILFPLVILSWVASHALGRAQSPQAELVIASEWPGGAIERLTDAFTQSTGIKVRFVSQGQAKFAAFLPTAAADLVMASVAEELEEAKRAGLLAKHSAAIDLASIPERFRDPDGYWVGYAYRVRSIFFNPARVTANEVSDYGQLADPKWKGRLRTRPMPHKYNQAMVAWYLALHGEAATQAWLEGIKQNALPSLDGGDKDQARCVSEGDGDLSITNSYYLVELLEDPATRVKAATNLSIMLPGQRTGGAFALVSSVALLKQAKHPAAANRFIEFLEGHLAQRWLADVLTVYPVRQDLKPIGFLKDYGRTSGVEIPKVNPVPVARITDQLNRARTLIEQAGFAP